ncbi:MAG: hypothetical protein H7844_04310, partial [Nitrospirae bacterium YQR-1]
MQSKVNAGGWEDRGEETPNPAKEVYNLTSSEKSIYLTDKRDRNPHNPAPAGSLTKCKEQFYG